MRSLDFMKRLNFVLASVNSESSFGYNVTESAAAAIVDTYRLRIVLWLLWFIAVVN